MKIQTLIVFLLLITALFMTACAVEEPVDVDTGEEPAQQQEIEDTDVDLVAEDEVDIGELI
jgi:PBP1b-binding outer membrane lipoprotein LpoB